MRLPQTLALSLALATTACGGDVSGPAPKPAAPAGPRPASTKQHHKAPDAAAATDDDWLIWYADDDGWHTRWITANGGTATIVAERDTLVMSDGGRLWQLQRDDHKTRVLPCICKEEPKHADCKTPATIDSPGLKAVELGSTASTDLVGKGDYDVSKRNTVVGDMLSMSLEVIGGINGTVLVETGVDGNYCGAHGLYERTFDALDVATGQSNARDFIAAKLPEALRLTAAKEMLALVKDCESQPGLTAHELANGAMTLADVRMQIKGGELDLIWHFEAPVMYACSADYAAHGEAHSGLIPAAATVGLGASLPPGVLATFTDIRRAYVVGWADLTLAGGARATGLGQFTAAPEDAWPPSANEQSWAPSSAPSLDPKARTLLKDGRTLTRGKDYAGAIDAFDTAIKLDPTYARAFGARGYAKLLSGDLDGATADCTTALSLKDEPKFQASAYFNLGLIAERRGDAEAATKAYTMSNTLRQTKQAAAALARLQEAPPVPLPPPPH